MQRWYDWLQIKSMGTAVAQGKLRSTKRKGSLVCGPAQRTGLPDDTISKQKSLFGYILEGLGIDNVGILMLWPCGIL
jgi:hypothetical protein